jgi:thiamine biosynthesis protein ThiS
MEIRVNGTPDTVTAGLSVQAYLERRGLDPKRVAVEVNASIVKRDAFSITELHDGDRVEIVHFVGGG